MWLVCSGRCGADLFRAVLAEVDVNHAGEYQAHRVTDPAYLCLGCGAPAFDLSGVQGEMDSEALDDRVAVRTDVLCPVCETRVSVLPGEECPNCGSGLNLNV